MTAGPSHQTSIAEVIDDFHRSLGELVIAYAHIEIALKNVMGNVAGLPIWKTMALFGAESATDVMRVIQNQRSNAPNEMSNSALIDYVFAQIRVLAAARNALVHDGPMLMPANMEDPSSKLLIYINNWHKAKSMSDIDTDTMELTDIDKIVSDCRTIRLLLEFIRTNGKTSPFGAWDRAANLSPNAWLYRPAPRRNQQRKNNPSKP